MRLLIANASTDGQPRKIARLAADRLADRGHAVELLHVEDAEGLDLARFAGAILAGSLHAGGWQKSLCRSAAGARAALDAMPTLVLPVSLWAAGTDPGARTGLTRCPEDFAEATGRVPGRIAPVAGAFRFSEYDCPAPGPCAGLPTRRAKRWNRGAVANTPAGPRWPKRWPKRWPVGSRRCPPPPPAPQAAA